MSDAGRPNRPAQLFGLFSFSPFFRKSKSNRLGWLGGKTKKVRWFLGSKCLKVKSDAVRDVPQGDRNHEPNAPTDTNPQHGPNSILIKVYPKFYYKILVSKRYHDDWGGFMIFMRFMYPYFSRDLISNDFGSLE